MRNPPRSKNLLDTPLRSAVACGLDRSRRGFRRGGQLAQHPLEALLVGGVHLVGLDAELERALVARQRRIQLARGLQGLADAARLETSPDRSSLWAGLFDLRDTLLGSTVEDLRALAA